ncbi:fatty-acid amide hydrolase 2 isoform X2 [Manduca sexta]|nr:fatty-acid amide hydrolase 2 isoform X2 [Manduca sexta]XP_037292994.1 fatty-acid amide hydrolase 2 isoform X2 [Manduca sexta]
MARQIFFIFRTYLDMIIDLIYSFFWEGKRQAIPDLEKRHSILMESAVSLAAKIRNKELKSEDLVNACIERIQSVNPIINAVTDERFEEARKEAKEIDLMIAKGLSEEEFKKKPFLGVPFTAKECHAVKGMLQTLGIKARAHVRAHEDAKCVQLLKEAGAIPIAVTNVPEINKWAETRNLVFGQTNNPYHTGRIVGGSSGGEAALVAAIGSPISLCSDIGGSTRMPAFYCGLFGLNPTAGYTSMEGSALRTGKDDTMASIGFVSRHCSDLGPLTKILVGEKNEELQIDRVVDLKNIKYYYVETSKDLRMSPICPDLRKAMNKVITNLTEEAPSGGAPKRYYHEGFNYMFALWRYWMTHETENFARMITNNTGEANFFVELAKKLVGMSNYTFAAILKLFDDQVMPKVNKEWAEKLTKELKEDLLSTLGSDGVLLFPSAPAPAPYHHSLYLRPFNFAYWAIFNVLRCPAAQVPLGLNGEGLPLGIQVVAAPKNEALCLAVAEHLGKAFGGYVPPCRVLS